LNGWSSASVSVDPRPAVTMPPVEVNPPGSPEVVEFDVAPAIAGALVLELGLPRSALVAVIARSQDTEIQPARQATTTPRLAGWTRAGPGNGGRRAPRLRGQQPNCHSRDPPRHNFRYVTC
jgi:hypothetical protein